MGDTTSIDELPTDNSLGGPGGNIQLQKTEMAPVNPALTQQVYSPNVPGVDIQGQNRVIATTGGVMQELAGGLQRASANGMTGLPSRDIPMNTDSLMQDPQIRPNYVPQQGNSQINDYISRHEMSNQHREEIKKRDTMEDFYQIIQIPLLVGILYFAFQLPVTRKYLLTYLPSVFSVDGNYNMSGLLFMSVLFAASYYGLHKVLDYFSV